LSQQDALKSYQSPEELSGYKVISLMNYTVSGSDTTYFVRFADFYFDGKYIGLKLVRGTTNVGTLNGTIILKTQ
jgi:hypothetical protein